MNDEYAIDVDIATVINKVNEAQDQTNVYDLVNDDIVRNAIHERRNESNKNFINNVDAINYGDDEEINDSIKEASQAAFDAANEYYKVFLTDMATVLGKEKFKLVFGIEPDKISEFTMQLV